MSFTLNKILVGMALAASLAGAAQAVPMSGLFNGGSITAGDKVFDNWTLVFHDASDGRAFTASNIDVTALTGDALDPGPGLRFAVDNGELNAAGDGIFGYVDLKFSFRVTVLDPSLSITSGSLAFSPAGAFWSIFADNDWDVGNYVRETIGTAALLDDLGTTDIEFSTLSDPVNGANPVNRLTDVASFAPKQQIWVTKNVLVWARDVDDAAGVFGFEQRFAQTALPEPASVALTGVALIGLFGLRRRQRR